MRALLAVALLAFAFPLAAAGPATNGCHAEGAACVWEHTVESGSCEDGEGAQAGSTTVEGNAGDARATAAGSESCVATDGSSARTTTLLVSLDSGSSRTAFQWTQSRYHDSNGGASENCFLLLDSDQGSEIHDCPAALGPPDAGWGHLLP